MALYALYLLHLASTFTSLIQTISVPTQNYNLMRVHGLFPKAITPLHLHPNPSTSLTDTKKSNVQQIPQCCVTNWGRGGLPEKQIKLQKMK